MDKIKLKKRLKLREKIGDYLLDISKYIITAVLITMFFNDISSSRILTYVAGGVTAVLTLVFGVMYYKSR